MNDSPLIILPRIITHKFVVVHPSWSFIYGDNLYNMGMLGQPWNMQKEPNTYHVPTLVKLCPSAADKFFTDDRFNEFKTYIDEALNKIPKNTIIIPLRKIGEGCSQMKWKAPKLFNYLTNELNKIKYGNIKWDYTAN